MISLRSKITQQLLGFLVRQPGQEMYINEMCRRFHVDRGNLVRKLQELETEGILSSRWRGHQRYYRLNSAFPLLKEYKQILLKTFNLENALAQVLRAVPGVREALLFGSYAKRQLDRSSDLDLLVVGDHQTIELHRAIARLQRTINRELNVISLGPTEYAERRKTDPFLKTILKKRRIRIL